MSQAESFAKYHDERARHGGASQEFHERAAAFLRTQEQVERWKRVSGGLERVADDLRARAEAAERELARLSLLDALLDAARMPGESSTQAVERVLRERAAYPPAPSPAEALIYERGGFVPPRPRLDALRDSLQHTERTVELLERTGLSDLAEAFRSLGAYLKSRIEVGA